MNLSFITEPDVLRNCESSWHLAKKHLQKHHLFPAIRAWWTTTLWNINCRVLRRIVQAELKLSPTPRASFLADLEGSFSTAALTLLMQLGSFLAFFRPLNTRERFWLEPVLRNFSTRRRICFRLGAWRVLWRAPNCYWVLAIDFDPEYDFTILAFCSLFRSNMFDNKYISLKKIFHVQALKSCDFAQALLFLTVS